MHVLKPALTLLLLCSCTEPNPYLGICGNGVQEPDFEEQCDLGDENGEGTSCTEECRLSACGDGLVQDGEACDLGEENNSSASCTPQCEFARCGDAYRLESEECDLGDDVNKDYDGLPGVSA